MANQQDMTQANGTYGGFATLMKWGTIIVAIVVAFVVIVIA